MSSPAQVYQALYVDLALKLPNSLSRQQRGSTEEPVLRLLAEQHTFPSLVLEFRKLRKIRAVWIKGLLKEVKGNRIHAIWHQVNTSTGRLACS